MEYLIHIFTIAILSFFLGFKVHAYLVKYHGKKKEKPAPPAPDPLDD